MATLTLHLTALGPAEVHLGNELLEFPTRKTLAMLFYLAVEAKPFPREHLAVFFWPEANTKRSYANLRNTLNHLQMAFQHATGFAKSAYLSITHNSLGLNPDANITLDLQTVEKAYSMARMDRSSRLMPDGSASLSCLQSAAACQRGDFMVGFSLGDAPAFDDWAIIQREVWHRRMSLVLDRLSEIQFALGDFTGAAETSSQWIAMDALNEIAYRNKMRAHFSAGERGQALETFETCRSILITELGIQPEPDTLALAERIRKQTPPRYVNHGPATLAPMTSDTSVAFLGQLFAGRIRDHELMVNCYRNMVAGHPQLVVLRGEAGMGKTRLARKFLDWASAQGADSLIGRTFESGSLLPFQPLVEALRFRLERENLPDDLLEDVSSSALNRLLPELLEHLKRSPNPPKINKSEKVEVSQTQIFVPIIKIIIALAKQSPLVVFIDDLQWADNATLDLLQYVIRRLQEMAAQVMVLACVRSEALHPVTQPKQAGGPQGLSRWLESVSRELTPVHIELGPLDADETIQMVLSILSPAEPDFAQWLYNETHGQPFYLMETLKDFLERRILHPKRISEGDWTFALDTEYDLGKEVGVPSTVHAVIRSRLNRLSPIAFSMLAAAAVLERQITFELLCSIAHVNADQALPAQDELISARLLVEAKIPDMTGVYIFINDMLRDVVYTEAGDARRRLFHQRVLVLLEESGESAAVLAHHAMAACMAKAAFHHSMIAGSDALRLSALNEALIHFEHAHQSLKEISPNEMPNQTHIREMYMQLRLAYEMRGLKKEALAVEVERNSLGI